MDKINKDAEIIVKQFNNESGAELGIEILQQLVQGLYLIELIYRTSLNNAFV